MATRELFIKAGKGFARVKEWWAQLPDTREGSLLCFCLRLAMSPALLVVDLCELPSRVVWVEPRDYGYTPGTSKIFISRLGACLRDSWTLLVESILFYIVLDFVAWLGLQNVVRHFKPDIERFYAALTGSWYIANDGSQHARSLLNAAGDDYDMASSSRPGGHSAECPYAGHREAPLDCPCRAHFLSTCAKVIYETAAVLQDVVVHRLGMSLITYADVPANMHRQRSYVPDMVWFAASNSDSLVICMKGADAFLKIDRLTDIPIARTAVPGELIKGFLRGLQQQDPASESGSTIFNTLVSLLQREGKGKRIFCTGHSLGGAIIVTFLQLLAAQDLELASSVTGVFTFGAPRFGDPAFCDLLAQRFQGCLFRYVHAADMVCKLPPGLGFADHCGKRFVTSFPVKHPRSRVLKEEDEPKLVQQWEQAEGRFAYLFTLCKLFISPAKEGWLRFGTRLSTCALPGLSDHFPIEYEQALKEDLLHASAAMENMSPAKALAAGA